MSIHWTELPKVPPSEGRRPSPLTGSSASAPGSPAIGALSSGAASVRTGRSLSSPPPPP